MIADEANIRIEAPGTPAEKANDIAAAEINQINRAVTEGHGAHDEGSQQLHADPPTAQDKGDVLSRTIIGAVRKERQDVLSPVLQLLIILLHIFINQSATTDSPFASYTDHDNQ